MRRRGPVQLDASRTPSSCIAAARAPRRIGRRRRFHELLDGPLDRLPRGSIRGRRESARIAGQPASERLGDPAACPHGCRTSLASWMVCSSDSPNLPDAMASGSRAARSSPSEAQKRLSSSDRSQPPEEPRFDANPALGRARPPSAALVGSRLSRRRDATRGSSRPDASSTVTGHGFRLLKRAAASLARCPAAIWAMRTASAKPGAPPAWSGSRTIRTESADRGPGAAVEPGPQRPRCGGDGRSRDPRRTGAAFRAGEKPESATCAGSVPGQCSPPVSRGCGTDCPGSPGCPHGSSQQVWSR